MKKALIVLLAVALFLAGIVAAQVTSLTVSIEKIGDVHDGRGFVPVYRFRDGEAVCWVVGNGHISCLHLPLSEEVKEQRKEEDND